jgi:hypothetical protein
MKLLSQRGISIAPPERAAVPASSSVPSASAVPSVPSVPALHAIPAVSAVSAIPTVPAVPAVPAVVSATVPAIPAAVSVPVSDTAVSVSTTALLTAGDEPADVSMESPPRPEGSSRATGGIFRNRAMGQHYNPVDDEDFQMSSIIGKVKGIIKIYVSPLDPVELDFANIQPSLKVPVTVNTNLGPVLKEVALRWPPIIRK